MFRLISILQIISSAGYYFTIESGYSGETKFQIWRWSPFGKVFLVDTCHTSKIDDLAEIAKNFALEQDLI